MKKLYLLLPFLLLLSMTSCETQPAQVIIPDRESLIPDTIDKIQPEQDFHPPLSLSDEFEQPVPLPYPVNTRGAEDSPFILPDGETLYVWFTPDSLQEVVLQSQDLVTGIYGFSYEDEQWSEPQRLWLSEPGKAVLDGCGFFSENQVWFCTVREGIEGMHWFTAEKVDGVWTNWQQNDFDPAYEVGEFHIHGDQLYYHSSRSGGQGGLDIWMLTRSADGGWENPQNISAVNTERDDGWPAISPDGTELWISRDYGLWRSQWENGEWGEPALMISPLAGEATLDQAGNVYFTHHYYDEPAEKMLEADIYVAYRK